MNPENNPISPNQNNIQEEKPKKIKFWQILKEVLIFAVIAFGIVLPFRIYIAEPYLVDGRSMDPTFSTNDYLIVDKLSYRRGTPQRNSVVVFKYPGNPAVGRSDANPSRSFIKRIIGLPGETVVVQGDTVKIINAENPDGFTVDQSYVVHKSPDSFTVTLAGDEYFVMGDNRTESFDSRSWGPLPKKYILGEPILRLWPIKNIEILPGDDKK